MDFEMQQREALQIRISLISCSQTLTLNLFQGTYQEQTWTWAKIKIFKEMFNK